MTLLPSILEAERRIRRYLRETPLEYATMLSANSSAEVWLKLENIQHTGSFKVRGALNALLAIPHDQRTYGIVAASSGNHGMATAFGLRALGMQGTIFVPATASPTKIAAIRAYGANVREIPGEPLLAELEARAYATHHKLPYISPYNDPLVVAGQGTLGVEIWRQSQTALDAVFIAVGGGGLIAGVATYLKEHWPNVEIIGCQPAQSAVMAESIQAGEIVELPDLPTLSDGTAGGIEPNAITFGLCQRLVDRFILVSEEEIAAAMRLMLETQHMLVEGAAGVALAGFLRLAAAYQSRRVGIVICGANVSTATLTSVLGG